MLNSRRTILTDIEKIGRIPVVPNILEIICRTTGMGFAAVARVTADKRTACAVLNEVEFNLKPGGELVLETTICNEIRQHQNPVVINHVVEDENFANHHTPIMYGFQSYISIPIILKNGEFFGTLCAIDPRPAVLNTPAIIGMFKMFAELIAFHFEALDKMDAAQEKLFEECEISELCEQFIAILGHDLRNPLNVIANSTQLIATLNKDEPTQRLVDIIRNSTFRMNGLIENMLDFASGKLGGGIKISKTTHEDLFKLLNQVTSEMQAVWPARDIKTSFNLLHPVDADGKRIAQLFPNLLANALNYSTEASVVEVEAKSDANGFQLQVGNSGNRIPERIMDTLFHPFSRGEVGTNKKGLGLDLFIASEIAKAHNGILKSVSSDNETLFTLNLPLK